MDVDFTPKSCCTFNYNGFLLARRNRTSASTSPESSDDSSGTGFSVEIGEHLILREFQQMVNRYNECFCLLQTTLADIALLRSDNVLLADDNLRLSYLLADLDAVSPTPSPAPETEKTPVPKSISVRSTGFLTGSGQRRLRLAASSPATEEIDGDDDEIEVYNQGTAKTELCNKWGSGGVCPYGDRCRFAHGVEELRPVIRHPRYKTQLCRMILGGGECPYGHRCHFRHSIPEPKTQGPIQVDEEDEYYN